MGHYNTEALNPLLGVLAVLRFKYQCLVAGEDLKCLGNVARTARYFHRPDLVHVDALSATLRTDNWSQLNVLLPHKVEQL